MRNSILNNFNMPILVVGIGLSLVNLVVLILNFSMGNSILWFISLLLIAGMALKHQPRQIYVVYLALLAAYLVYMLFESINAGMDAFRMLNLILTVILMLGVGFYYFSAKKR